MGISPTQALAVLPLTDDEWETFTARIRSLIADDVTITVDLERGAADVAGLLLGPFIVAAYAVELWSEGTGRPRTDIIEELRAELARVAADEPPC